MQDNVISKIFVNIIFNVSNKIKYWDPKNGKIEKILK